MHTASSPVPTVTRMAPGGKWSPSAVPRRCSESTWTSGRSARVSRSLPCPPGRPKQRKDKSKCPPSPKSRKNRRPRTMHNVAMAHLLTSPKANPRARARKSLGPALKSSKSRRQGIFLDCRPPNRLRKPFLGGQTPNNSANLCSNCTLRSSLGALWCVLGATRFHLPCGCGH